MWIAMPLWGEAKQRKRARWALAWILALFLSLRPCLALEEQDFLKDLSRRGTELLDAGRYREASKLFEQAVRASEREFGTDDPRTASQLNNLGLSLYYDSDLHGAEVHY